MKKKLTPEQLLDSYQKAVVEDYIGLWQVIGNVKTEFDVQDGKDVQARTLDLVRGMLMRGFRPGYLAERGGFEDWPDQNPDSIIRRIEAEWNDLGNEPNINDICWFTRD